MLKIGIDILLIYSYDSFQNIVVQPTWKIRYSYYVVQKFLTYTFTYILATDPTLMWMVMAQCLVTNMDMVPPALRDCEPTLSMKKPEQSLGLSRTAILPARQYHCFRPVARGVWSLHRRCIVGCQVWCHCLPCCRPMLWQHRWDSRCFHWLMHGVTASLLFSCFSDCQWWGRLS